MDDKNKKEIRNTSYQVTGDDEKRTVEGYALLFGVRSDGLSFEEEIQRGSLDGVLAKSDVFALLNHDRGRGILARSKKGSGSLTLSVDEKGLKYRFEAPKTALGDELLENIRRGEVDESSLPFPYRRTNGRRKATEAGSVLLSRLKNCTMCLRCITPPIPRRRFICAVRNKPRKSYVNRKKGKTPEN